MIEALPSVNFLNTRDESNLCVLADVVVVLLRSLLSFKQIYSVKVTRYSTYYTEKPEANFALILRCPLSLRIYFNDI